MSWRRHLSQTTTIGDDSQAGCASHTSDTTPNNRWSCVRCCRTSSVEQSAYRRRHGIVRRHLQTAFEDFLFTQSFDVWRTVTFVVTCPWSLGLRQAKYWRINNNNNNNNNNTQSLIRIYYGLYYGLSIFCRNWWPWTTLNGKNAHTITSNKKINLLYWRNVRLMSVLPYH